MAYFTATVTEAVETNRLLSLSNSEQGATLSIATAGQTPDFYSTRSLTADESIRVSITGKSSWNIEASEDIQEGSLVDIGEGGTLINVTTGEGVGYITNTVVAGELANLVLTVSGGKGPKGEPGPEGPKGPAGPKGDPGADGFPTETQWNDLVARVDALEGTGGA
ncbi:head fiber protein [Virgibacillus salexigens]|uniref:Collagen-like protein n=1 Tax=Virgibacillus kapii TaxID=1638645 RepID=A0ABQ2DCB9_9BACI|nr:head fiber protein [Virgibacillus kapii]GGJ50937.1 hypothetical protein GCM10007111_11530 [Virgibacillus kapii]